MKWMKFKWLYFTISALVIIPGVFSLLKYGLKPSIDFTGGTLLELRFKKEIKGTNFEEIKPATVQFSGENTLLIRSKPLTKEEATVVKETIAKKVGETPEEIRFETVGSIIGKELLLKTIVAIFLASIFILLYVARQFKNAKFGICAILAMFHDSLVILGSFSLFGYFFGVEVDTLFVTAVLTILSFSVHDTVVVYDRIRESQRLFPNTPFEQIADKAVTETLSRSLNNSLTIIFMLVALLLLGGQTIKWFTAALLIGTVSGTYSSTFTAVPLLAVWEKLKIKS